MTRVAAGSPVGVSEGEATRARIQEAAKKLIAIQGFAATTVRQIARKVSIKGGSLYYHFKGKDEILFAIFDVGNRVLLDAGRSVLAESLENTPAILQRLIEEHVKILVTDPAQFMVVTRELNRLTGERRKKIMAQRKEYESLWQEALARGIREGTIRKCNVKVVSYGLIACLNGVAYWFNPEGPLEIEEIGAEYGRMLLNGLLVRRA